MTRKYASFAFIILLLMVSCTQTAEEISLPSKIQSESKAKSANFSIYENMEYGIKIEYPSDWKTTEPEGIIAMFSSPGTNGKPSANLNLVMNDLDGQDMTLPKYNEAVISQLKTSFPDIVFIESGSTVLSNMPAYKVVYTSSKLKIMQVWTIKNDISYIWTYTAKEDSYTDFLSAIQKMLDSFEITKNLRGDSEEKTEAKATVSVSDADPAFAGSWRVYSERIFYDIGGAGSTTVPVTRKLELMKDGTWAFGDSNGKWVVTEITSDDWTRWGISSYGPTRKVTLQGWNKGTADGPVEEEKGQIDFIWVIYHVEPPQVQNAGTIWIKFGH